VPPSLRELLLTDAAAVLSTRLIDDPHLAALRLFRRRTLFANTQKDVLVGFATSALLCDAAGGADAPPRASAFAAGDGAFAATTLLPPLRGEQGGVAPTHTLRDLRCEGAGAGEAPQTHEGADAQPAAHLSPRLIATALRQALDWRLVALRYTTSRLPVAHVACLGMVPRFAAAPAIVRRVAQEIVELQ
ncbi:uncharacterized protein Tco025E_09783, partial [Trypanosoma conorhini]